MSPTSYQTAPPRGGAATLPASVEAANRNRVRVPKHACWGHARNSSRWERPFRSRYARRLRGRQLLARYSDRFGSCGSKVDPGDAYAEAPVVLVVGAVVVVVGAP